MACWALVAAVPQMAWRARRHSLKSWTWYPVKATSSGLQTSLEDEPREWRARAREAAAIRLGENWRNLSPWSRESSQRN